MDEINTGETIRQVFSKTLQWLLEEVQRHLHLGFLFQLCRFQLFAIWGTCPYVSPALVAYRA